MNKEKDLLKQISKQILQSNNCFGIATNTDELDSHNKYFLNGNIYVIKTLLEDFAKKNDIVKFMLIDIATSFMEEMGASIIMNTNPDKLQVMMEYEQVLVASKSFLLKDIKNAN
jgi:hypothetical protein